MKITLANETELEALGVRGESIHYQGMDRDCLCISFDPEQHTLAEIDGSFTPENCRALTLTDESGSYIHTGYIIRRSLEKGRDSRGGGSALPPERIVVKMAQISYLEQQAADLTDAVDALILSGLEG